MSTVSSSPSSKGFTKDDLKSGFLVFLIALPLSLGIAMASGFPPVAGVLTAIVGGIVVTFLGGSRLTIKGPAAGLIVIALGAVQELGGGDLALGYKRALAVGVVAAVLQIGFAVFRTATAGIAMSPSVVHGMLAAIGVIIVSKQAHTMVGIKPEAKEPLELLAEIPQSFAHANVPILIMGGAALVILFGMPLIRSKWVKMVPPPVIVLLVAVPLGLYFDLEHVHAYNIFHHHYDIGPDYLVQLPGSLLDAIAFPDFSVVFSAASLKYVVMYAMVGTIESTLSVLAVDSMDPEKRASDLNRDLLGVGIGNLICSFIGGLPMISEIVRSKANVDSGAKSKWSNFSHGAFLLIFVALLPGLLSMIPLAALAAMLVYTGARLASPKEFVHAKHVGIDQLVLFLVTFVVTLATDLLIGVAAGIVVKFILHGLRGVSIASLFRPKVKASRSGSTLEVEVQGAATFMALLALRKELAVVDDKIENVRIDLSNVALVDHTFLSRLDAMSQEWSRAKLCLVGIESFEPSSDHVHASRKRRSHG